MRGETTIGDDERGQSEVLGVALIMALVVIGTVGIVALGTDVLAGARGDAQIESAEQAMTKFDATAALVALGETDSQRATVSLRGIDESLSVKSDEGWMNITIVNRSSGDHLDTVMNKTLGSVVYEKGGTQIAYQGGGVWKKVEGGSIMVSPPEFHYRGNTLTLPLISVSEGGDGVVSGDLVMKREGTRNQTYPNASANFLNPLPKEKQVNVTVHSEYYDAWGRFFAQRTDGSVTYDDANNTVVVELVVPFDAPFEQPLIATDPGGVDINGNCDPGGDGSGCGDLYISGVEYTSPDTEIEERIDSCEEADNDCEYRNASTTENLDEDKTYYFDSGITDGEFTVDTSQGDVNIVVNGDMDVKDIDVTGDNKVNVYVRGDVTSGGDAYINENGTPDQFIMYVHSEGEFDFDGKVYFSGLIYAPNSDADFNGIGQFRGSIVAKTIAVNGGPSNTVNYPGLNRIDLGLDDDIAYVNYLYVSSIDLRVNGTAS